MFTHSVASTAARDFIQIERPHNLKGVLQSSKIVEFSRTPIGTKTQPRTERLHCTWGQLHLLTINDSPRN